MRVLVPLTTIEMAIDRVMRVLPDLEKGVGRMLFFGQWQVIVIQNGPRVASIKWRPFSLRQENVGFEGILEKAINAGANLKSKTFCLLACCFSSF